MRLRMGRLMETWRLSRVGRLDRCIYAERSLDEGMLMGFGA